VHLFPYDLFRSLLNGRYLNTEDPFAVQSVVAEETKSGRSEREMRFQSNYLNIDVHATIKPALQEYPSAPFVDNSLSSLFVDQVLHLAENLQETKESYSKLLEKSERFAEEVQQKSKLVASYAEKTQKQKAQLAKSIDADADSSARIRELNATIEDLQAQLKLAESNDTRFSKALKQARSDCTDRTKRLEQNVEELKMKSHQYEQYNECLLKILQQIEAYVDSKRYPDFPALLQNLFQGANCNIDVNSLVEEQNPVIEGGREKRKSYSKKKQNSK
jgi:hypothetical protein